MKKLFPLLLLLFFHAAEAQRISARIVDASNNKGLSYAIVLFDHKQKVTYSNADGFFSLSKDSIPANDTLLIQYIGFQQLEIRIQQFQNNAEYKLTPQMHTLESVIISSCRNTEEFQLNKNVGRIRQYIGPGPETRLIIIARYNNISGIHGYINRVSILFDEITPNVQVPVRLHWYAWDVDKHMPGKELTDSSILVYPYRKGWNDFDVPPYTIPAPKDWIVFGLEFIYIPAYTDHYDSLKTNSEKLKWLNDMQNRWSLSMEYIKNSDETGFYIVNNGTLGSYSKRYDRYFIRPALRFNITVCRE
jgi:CarboxypepD_reg-like domain